MAELKEGILKLFKEHYGMTDEEAQEYYKEQFEIVKKTAVKEEVEGLRRECMDVLDEVNKTGKVPELIF
ncbi:hypothetical protein BCB68_07210 [Leptotrichia sp. oral taxon 498]|uniref:hypothetical protein n=1 Tax=Leptotrichia sp. oral taxon 498 TaxID=712368 RepID=UPI000B8CC483|nr:hypothetical protein [Leptotrichia sp. oral taxon 498]ASQ48731.1 hypothetical protein BCB68_07210 [Leptotrichia sp. oral taxon 498]